MHHHIGICVVAQSDIVVDGVKRAIDFLESATAIDSVVQKPWQPDDTIEAHQLMEHLLVQARAHLIGSKHQFNFSIYHHTSFEAAMESISADSNCTIDIVISDESQLGYINHNEVNERLLALHNVRPGSLSPHSFIFSLDTLTPKHKQLMLNDSVRLCLRQKEPLIWSMQVIKTLMDHLDASYINPMFARVTGAIPMVSSVAQFVFDYMQHNFSNNWHFRYYTGSMISGLIDSTLRLCQGTSISCESGANEHSLAVSALCGWQFFRQGYVIAITSGMIDEFRGTLYNLKRAKAPGIILCADSPDGSWFPFQGTLHKEYDGRKTIEAKGIPTVYLEDTKTLPEQLTRLAEKLHEKPGPIFVFATQAALEAVVKSDSIPKAASLPTHGRATSFNSNDMLHKDIESPEMDEVMNLLNEQRRRVLWQCSHLNDQERELVYKIADKTGIALTDTMTNPGEVSDYYNNQKVQNYIGTLSVYGFNRRVFQYLHEGQKLASASSQSFFFLKSKVDQAASPFSASKLKNKCHVVQVNSCKEHMSPYTDIGIESSLLPFLKTVLNKLNVDEEVLAFRRQELQRVSRTPITTPVDWLPQIPMSPNYFYARFAHVLHKQIQSQGFSYKGVYDVGRCGVSAIRNLPKTGKGFSGWYGRALMGDALMSLPYLAQTSDEDILAFIGDGARDLTPNVEHQIEQAFKKNPNRDRITISVFYLCNGVLSMIRSYIDVLSASQEIKQTSLTAPSAQRYELDSNSPQRKGMSQGDAEVSVNRTQWSNFDEEVCHRVLDTKGTINFVDVMLAHNSDGDGLSLLSETAWHRVNIA